MILNTDTHSARLARPRQGLKSLPFAERALGIETPVFVAPLVPD